MIILTGGGGMIGSMIAWHLNTQMNFDDFVIVDDLINNNKKIISISVSLLNILKKTI